MLEELGKDFRRAARTKGLTGSEALWRHVVRNTQIPLLTSPGSAVAGLVGGRSIVEGLFDIPGIASEELTAMSLLDSRVIEGATILLAAAVFMNLVADVTHGLMERRVRSAEKAAPSRDVGELGEAGRSWRRSNHSEAEQTRPRDNARFVMMAAIAILATTFERAEAARLDTGAGFPRGAPLGDDQEDAAHRRVGRFELA